MERAERWARARDETHGLKDWKRGVATAVVAGICSVAALALFGPEEAEMSEALVVGGSIIGAYVLRPLAELAWNFLWAPWRELNEVVSRLGQDRAPKTADPDAVNRRFQAVSARLEVLRRLEAELRETQKAIAKAQVGRYRSGLDGRHYFWNEIEKSGFKGLQDMQSFYAQLRDCMDKFDAIEIFKVSSSGDLSDRDQERLEEAKETIDNALGLIRTEIDRLVAIK